MGIWKWLFGGQSEKLPSSSDAASAQALRALAIVDGTCVRLVDGIQIELRHVR